MSESRMWRQLFPEEPFHFGEFHHSVRNQAQSANMVLDLGCGDNSAFSHLRSEKRIVWGVDSQAHPDLIDQDWFRPLDADGSIPFPAEHFDLVVSLWVLEHIIDPLNFLREVSRVLRPGGIFLAHSVNARHYVTWIRRFIGLLPHKTNQWLVQRVYGRPMHDTFPAYYRLNTPAKLERIARQAGLRLCEYRQYADPGYFAFHPLTLEMAVTVDYLLERLGPGWGRIYFSALMDKPAGIPGNGGETDPNGRYVENS